jgi:hypothetical protein
MNQHIEALTTKWTAFGSFEKLLKADGGYRPSLTRKNQEVRELADAYDKAQEARGDQRRAYRG